jgi:hypothetical protein
MRASFPSPFGRLWERGRGEGDDSLTLALSQWEREIEMASTLLSR